MDVSGILATQAERHNAVTVEKDTELQLDIGYLTVTDPNPIPAEEYNCDLEAHLQSTARDGVQVLLSALLQLPTQSIPDGPLTLLPPPTTLLPRAKPLPKPKPPTKWERFAAAKGIQKKRKDRKVWDEERGEWVAKWGKDAKNKEGEGQWITEVKANADVDANPEKELRDTRKARVTKNEKQQLQNLAVATRESRKSEIERTLATTRASTASMGKFDRTLEGEKKPRGVKRKFDPTERSVEEEKKASLALISKLDSSGKKSKGRGDDVLNVRKAIRIASKGKGSVALAQERSSKRSKKGSKSKSGKR
ncbi:RRS1 [Sanghuangporus sanghuang]